MRDEPWQDGRRLKHDEFGAQLVKAFDDGQVGEDFDDGPALGGGLPLEQILRQISKKDFKDGGAFLEQRDGGLNRRRSSGLHRPSRRQEDCSAMGEEGQGG